MNSEVRTRLAAILVAVLLTSCTTASAPPTPTLISFPTLAPAQGAATTEGETEAAQPAGAPTEAGQPTAGLPTSGIVTELASEAAATGEVSSETAAPTTAGGESTVAPALAPLGASATPTGSGTTIHVVAPGESLISIATQYGVTPDDIRTANHLTDPNLIFVGQQLIIPTVGSAPSPANCIRDAAFVADVTVPDNSVFQPGQTFTKTWRVKNTGSCSWDNTYTVVFGIGNQLGALSFVPLPQAAPGGTVDISIAMTAPLAPGRYTSTWYIRGPDGITFGINPFVIIMVVPQGQPIPTAAPTATPPPAPTQNLAAPLPYPAVSGVTLNARNIWLSGQAKGNRRDVFAKIGDSLTDEPWFLNSIGDGKAVWGSYGNLQPVASFFMTETARTANSFSDKSVATHGGWDSFSPLDPANSTPWDFCGSDTPIDCELRVVKPSVALIMLGTNEASDHLSSGSYEQNLDKMVQTSINHGVIPVLYTIPWNKFRDPQPFNVVITRVARQYDIPLVDFWSVIDPLPNHGISGDGVHPTVPPDQNTANFTGNDLNYGYTQRNVVTLQVLDVIWRYELYQ